MRTEATNTNRPSSAGKRLCSFARGRDEQLGDWTEAAPLQTEDSTAGIGSVTGSTLKPRRTVPSPVAKSDRSPVMKLCIYIPHRSRRPCAASPDRSTRRPRQSSNYHRGIDRRQHIQLSGDTIVRAYSSDAGEFPRELFRKHGIAYDLAKQTKSELFRDLLPLLNSGRIVLPRNDRLQGQIVGLERRTSAVGRDTISHPERGHDDVANAVAGAAALSNFGGYDTSLRWVSGDDDDSSAAWQRVRLQAFINSGGRIRL